MHSLVAYHNDTEFFTSDGPWLYPLLELQTALAESGLKGKPIRIFDKIVGRAGALLAAHLGVTHIDTDLLSSRAVPVLKHHNITYSARVQVERIMCATEDLLEHELSPEKAWEFIEKRVAARAGTVDSTANGRDTEVILKLTDLTISRDGRDVIKHASLAVKSGETALITGANGAGKTTLLRAILGILTDRTGSIEVLGHQVGSRDWNRSRRLVAYVRQTETPTDLPIQAREVVEIGARAVATGSKSISERSLAALSMVGAEHLALRQFGRLSGGERQRVSLARALAQGPRLLLMDEPTAGLDEQSRTSLLELLSILPVRHNLTLVVVSHDIQPDDLDAVKAYHIENGVLTSGAGTQTGR